MVDLLIPESRSSQFWLDIGSISVIAVVILLICLLFEPRWG